MSQGVTETLNGSGQGTATAAGGTLATVNMDVESNDVQASFDSSKYCIHVDAGQAGTIDTANLVNLGLYSGSRLIGKVTSAAYPFRTTYRDVFVGGDRASNGSLAITVKAIGAFGAGAITSVNIIVERMG